MVSKRSIPARYSYHRPILSDVHPFEVPPTFSNGGFFDFVTRYDVRLEQSGRKTFVVWECSDDRLDQVIQLLFKTCRKHAVASPPSGTDRNFIEDPTQSNLVRDGKTKYIRKWKLSDYSMRTRPYGFDIAHKEREFRRLSVVHPRNQLAVAHFYHLNGASILYHSGLSDISIRHPASVAKTVKFSDRLFYERQSRINDSVEESSKEYENLGSYFSYRSYSNIFKFFEHYKYHNAEKKFDLLLRLDISKCFDSIYTHSLPWSTLGTGSAKDYMDESKKTFGGRFDRLMQEMNQGETNGIVIGPEFSRIFAEIILQYADRSFKQSMGDVHGYRHRVDYQAFRYVDDYFIFCTSQVDLGHVERQLGIALKELKLGVNASKSTVIHKPIITKLTIAKNRVRVVLGECIEIYENEVEYPIGTGTLVRKYTPRVRSNNLIVGFKSILEETGVEYKDILNYSFAALERNTSAIFRKNEQTQVPLRDDRKLTQALIGILEFSFFIYAADPRVNISIRLARLISLMVDQMNEAGIGRDSKHQVFKYIFDNVARQLRRTSTKGRPNIEVMYLILALRKLGREYLVSEEALAGYFGMDNSGQGRSYKASSEMDYFAVTVGLSYATEKRRYSRFRQALEEALVTRVKNRKAYVHNETEPLMAYLDIACCPFVSARTKYRLAGIFGHSVTDFRAVKSASPFWFTDWKGFDLSIALDKKRTREVY